MDTTLRDGEQTSGVSFVPHEKLMIARLLLEELKVDRVEVASARVSEGERNAVKIICDWAARRDLLPRVEVLGFVDGHASVDWICSTGCRVINLLCKGSEKHCHYQLKKTPQEHIDDILRVVDYAQEQGMEVNVYLEDWSGGMKESISRLCVPADGCLARQPRPPLHAARHAGHTQPPASHRVHAQDDEAVSRGALRLPRAQRLRPGRLQRPGRRPERVPRTAYHHQRAGGARRECPVGFRASHPEGPLRGRDAHRREPMPMATTSATSTATTSCPNASAAAASMPWARTRARPTSARTSRTWASSWTRSRCGKSPSASSSWATRRSW